MAAPDVDGTITFRDKRDDINDNHAVISDDTQEDYISSDSDIDSDFRNIEILPPSKRNVCDRCRRPVTVCWCAYLPREPLNVKTTIYILQHPFEESRPLKTAPMLYNSLPPGKCCIFKGKRFPYSKFPDLEEVFSSPNTLLMYPSGAAEDIHEVCRRAPPDTCFNLILLDGTWPQARGIFCQNAHLHSLRQVQLSGTGLSEYVIRTQPTDKSLSTLESAAIAISVLENKPELKEILVRPLRALCAFQMEFGAVKHHSKQYLVENGLYEMKGNKKGNHGNKKKTQPQGS